VASPVIFEETAQRDEEENITQGKDCFEKTGTDNDSANTLGALKYPR